MELIEGSETSAIRTQTPGNYPKENTYRTRRKFKIKNSTAIPHLPIALDAAISSFRQLGAFVKEKVQVGRVCQKKAWNEWDSARVHTSNICRYVS